jgi:CubicO group peptidase (beta-lactamase class C family)
MRKLLVLALLCLANMAFAANEGFDAEIDRLIGPLVEERLIPGYYVSVYNKDGLLFEKSSGLADDRTNLPPGEDVLYFIDSMSKPLTGLLMIRLQELGKLQFDDPIEKYLPQFANLTVLPNDPSSALPQPVKSSVTIRHLLTHTSGFTTTLAPAVNNGVVGSLKKQRIMTRNSIANSKVGNLAAQITKLSELPLVSQPGEKFEYSVGYDIAGRIAEVVTGQDLAAAMQTFVFAPLGMEDSFFVIPQAKQSKLARLYGPHGRSYQVPGKPKRYRKYAGLPKTQSNFGLSAAGYQSGSIGVLTTAQDYSRLLRMILNGGIVNGSRWLSKAGLQRLTVNQLPENLGPSSMVESLPSMTNSGYSFGVGIKVAAQSDLADVKNYQYLYWASAANTQFFVDSEAGVAGIFMTQHVPARYFFLDRMRELAVQYLAEQQSN